jgi:hypothetical protein
LTGIIHLPDFRSSSYYTKPVDPTGTADPAAIRARLTGLQVCRDGKRRVTAEVPGDAAMSVSLAGMDIVCREPLYLTKISDDSYIPVTKDRILAADADLVVDF